MSMVKFVLPTEKKFECFMKFQHDLVKLISEKVWLGQVFECLGEGVAVTKR